MKLMNTTALLLLVACSSSDPGRDDCADGHCDTPKGTVKQVCDNSHVSAMDERRPHFTPAGVRWSCKDVNGVTASSNTRDSRGQEYCEYFSLLHKEGIPSVVSDAFCDANTRCATGTCDLSINSCVTATTVDTSRPAAIFGKNLDDGDSVSPLNPTLSAGQIEWLAQNPTQKVGECMFTSWHQDVDRPLMSTATVAGYRLDANTPNTQDPLFRMGQGVNSNGAAQALVGDCLIPGKNQALKDGFDRGCNNCGSLGNKCVPFRKSDPSVCTMAMRIAECGCKVDVKAPNGTSRTLNLSKQSDLALAKELFVPESRRGFVLGTWDGIDKLPNGCRFIETGDPKTVNVNGVEVPDPVANHTIVACDLLASHVTSAAMDPKEACRVTYGDEVVVHVRAPTPDLATLTCDTTKPKCAGAPWDYPNVKPN